MSRSRQGHITVEGGIRLHFRTVGRDADVLVVPGGFLLEKPLARLAEERTLLFYDMRGRGRSNPVADPDRLGVDRDVDDLEAIRVELGLDRVTLLGWSYLGAMVAKYAIALPERVERLVQVGSVGPRPGGAGDARAYHPDPADLARLEAMRAEGRQQSDLVAYTRQYWRVFKPMLVADPASARDFELPAQLENEWPKNLTRTQSVVLDSLRRYDLREAAKHVATPVLGIHGTEDRLAPYEGAREWIRSFPNARLLSLPGVGHLPFAERPAVFFPAVDAFLNGSWPNGSEELPALPPAGYQAGP